MSPCLNNLLEALRAMLRMEPLPTLLGELFFEQIDKLAALDAARADYYADDRSRRIFDWVQQYQAVRSFYDYSLPVHLKNSPFGKDEWALLEQRAAGMTPRIADDYLLDRIDTWILECYSLKGECEALPGDIVLDCGTYTGNTSLYFSEKVGVSGHVYGFEASGVTFEKYARNMRGVDNVTPVRAAVGNTAGTLRLSGSGGPGASIDDVGEEVPALTLDGFCLSRGLTKVDFIKMDVEGAEEDALKGAERIIREHRPRMALSAYHKFFDIAALPARVLSLAPYTFKLRHFSDCAWETVLYCMPAESIPPASPPAPAFTSRQCREMLFLLLPMMRKVFLACRLQNDQRLRSMMNSLETATQVIQQLLGDNKRLGAENAALGKALEKLGAKAGTRVPEFSFRQNNAKKIIPRP